MMMAATRRSFRAQKTSSKSKRRSRKSHHDHHDPDQQYRSIDYSHPEETDRRSDGDRKYRSSSAPGVSSRHGDIGDSGIDSGNGHVEPENVQARLGLSISQHVESHQISENQYSSSPKRRIRASEASVTSSDNSLQRETADENFASRANLQAHPSDETRSKHRKRKTSESEENLQKASSVREKANVVNHEPEELSSSADNTSVAETQSRTDKPHSTRSVSQDSETSSISSNYADQQLQSKEEKKVVNGEESKRTVDVARESEESSESEQETSDSGNDDRKQLDAMSMTSERQKRKRKLQARLEQAKHSLASPHITAAVEAYESSEGTLTGPQEMSLMQEFRRLFHQELIRLRLELDTFRHFCSKQMESEAESVFSRHRDRQTEEETKKEDTARERSDCCTQTKEAEGEGSKDKKVKNPEEMDDWEEKLTARQNDLLDYEKEILEVETMLNQRQAICERRQSALLALDEELQSLREDIFNKKENLRSDSDTNVERARKNWDLIRRHLTDKQAMLEAAVQRYKTQIASSNAALAAKDTLIAHLQKQLKESQETLKARDKKIGHLEGKLVLATEEMHVLNSRQDPGSQPPDTDPLSLSQTRRASLRPGSGLLQRQRSEASDRSGTGRGSSVKSSASDIQQSNNTALERNSGYRTGSERRKSTAHLPDTVLARGKSSTNLARSQSARERRKHQRRNSTAGTGEEAVNSAACAIL